ncbi:MAG: hydroxymethylbilane synthase [Alphaproteobacteria bacterium]|nr:hydroxymethylbilane synthase [Alphaproteobacteria bacterium]
MTRTFVIGTRGSPLALAQTKFVEDYLTHLRVDHRIHTIKTTGDKIQDKPLYDIGGKALFSKEIERSLFEKECDIGVHSLKDLETPRPHGLELVAYLPRADARDVLVTRFDAATNTVHGCPVGDLPQGVTLGTSAPRRASQLHHHRPDLNIISVRGNVGTRLSKLGQGYDAIVFAKAGLDRLGINIDPAAILDLDTMIPAVGQGIIALECRSDDSQTKDILRGMNDLLSEKAALVERGFIERLEGASCRSAVGIHAVLDGTHIHLRMMVENNGFHTTSKLFPSDTPMEEIWDILLCAARVQK